jgi:hypothetical protein
MKLYFERNLKKRRTEFYRASIVAVWNSCNTILTVIRQ